MWPRCSVVNNSRIFSSPFFTIDNQISVSIGNDNLKSYDRRIAVY